MIGTEFALSSRDIIHVMPPALPGISVVVPAYNSERSLRRCLESILGSEYPREQIETICVDNGSADRTARIATEFAPAVTLIHAAKRGPAAARNAGIQAATHSIVAFTDSDCVVDSAWLGRIVEPLLRGTADVAGGRILARPQARPVELFGELVHDHARAIESYQPPYLITMNLAARRDLLRSIGCFDERWIRMEDVDITYRILAAGQRIAYRHDAIVYHHNRDSVGSLAREGFLHGYYRREFLRVHRDFIRTYRERHGCVDSPTQPQQAPPAASLLRPWQIRLFWSVFNCGKRTGEIAGHWFPPKIQPSSPQPA